MLKTKGTLIAVLLCCSTISPAQWANVGSSSISNVWTTYNDIAIDTSDAPVVVFNEATTDLKCQKFNGTQWQDVGLSSFTFPFGGNTQILIDSVSNTYYISFIDINTNYPSIVKYNGSVWTYAGSQYMVNEFVNDFVMAIDSSGVLYCAFLSSGGFELFKENGSSWQQVSTTGLVSPISQLAITFDQQNNLLLAFTNMNNLNASCMKLNGSVWQQLGNANITTGGFAQYNKIGVSNANEVFLATLNVSTCCYKLNSSGVWQQLGTSGLGFNFFGIDDLLIDQYNQPNILNSDLGGSKARCVYYNGSGWLQSCGTPISDTTASSVAMEMDSDGYIYAIYNNYSGGSAYVRKCLSVVSANEFEENGNVKIYPNPSMGIIQVEVHKKAVVKFYNVTGGLILEAVVDENNRMVDLSELPGGVYFVSLYDGISHNRVARQKVILIK
jgi:hypothetical protein